MTDTRTAITAEQAIAAMAAVEADTFQRCQKAVNDYIALKSRKANGSRIAEAKVLAAQDIATLITKLPRKSKEAPSGR